MDLNVLERMLLDENAKPMNLTLSLLKDVTNGFSLDHQIGSGGFAVVYKGTVGKLGVAVKKLTKTHLLPESKFHKEVECLMKARHRNIVRFLGYCAETQGKAEDCEGRFVMADMRNWLLCFEYVPNGSLEKYISDASSGLEWRERFGIIKGICHGIHYLHKNRILHLDLKPANILLDDHMEPKIADFGLSRCLDEEQTRATTKHLSGTPGYLAPEFFNGKVAFASDIYSLGIIIMEILTGAKGYPEDENVTESWMNRLEGELQLEQVRVCTKIGIECMESDPKKRPVALRIINMLDKMASADETGRSSSVVEPQSSLLLEHSAQEKIGKLAESLSHEDGKEYPATEDVAERLGNDYSEEDQESDIYCSSSWEWQDTDRKTKSSVLDKLNIFNIFRKDEGSKLRGLTTFTKGEMKKITRNYSALIGEGSSGKVYKGCLADFTIVAVTVTEIKLNRYLKEEFLKEVEIWAQMVHTNIIKLTGYCVETNVLTMVHEYTANGSLQEILHGNKNKMLPLDLRLDIAIGSAEGLRYMHSRNIRHGDVNPTRIFLTENLTPKLSDHDLTPKVSDHELSPFTMMDNIDPVFLKCGILTGKSDVYSFGAVLLELITRKLVNSGNCSLITEYCKIMEIEKSGRAMFDKEIAVAEDISVLEEIGKLAIECLREDMEERPDMTVVTERLVTIRRDSGLRKARSRR